MAEPRSVYFPLRSNAHGVLAGAQFSAFRRRLKVAALLHDRLLVHNGSWLGIGGPQLTYQVHFPPGAGAPQQTQLQTPRDRHNFTGGTFSLSTSRRPDDEPTLQVAESTATVMWQTTFEPIRTELPRAYPWIEFDNFYLLPEQAPVVTELTNRVQDDPLLVARYEDVFTRHMVAESAAYTMVLGAAMGSSVSMDRLHGSVLATLVANGEASPVLGHRALVAVLPDVRDLAWSDVNEARGLPGLPRLRAVLGEVEACAMAQEEFDEAAIREFHNEYRRAVQAAAGWGSVGASILVGGAVSLASLPVAGPAGIVFGVGLGSAVEVGRYLLGRQSRRNTWVAAADELAQWSEATQGPPD